MAFELNTSYYKKKLDQKDMTEDLKNEIQVTEINPKCMDIIHYSFNYVGILTGSP